MNVEAKRSDAIWELLGDHLVELVENRRKLKALAEYRDEIQALVWSAQDRRYVLSGDLVAHKLSEILNGTGL